MHQKAAADGTASAGGAAAAAYAAANIPIIIIILPRLGLFVAASQLSLDKCYVSIDPAALAGRLLVQTRILETRPTLSQNVSYKSRDRRASQRK